MTMTTAKAMSSACICVLATAEIINPQPSSTSM